MVDDFHHPTLPHLFPGSVQSIPVKLPTADIGTKPQVPASFIGEGESRISDVVLTRASDVKTSNFLNFVSRSRRNPTCRDAAGEHWDFNRRSHRWGPASPPKNTKR